MNYADYILQTSLKILVEHKLEETLSDTKMNIMKEIWKKNSH